MQTRFQFLLVPPPHCVTLGQSLPLYVPRCPCSVKCKPVVPTSEAEATASSANVTGAAPRSRWAHRAAGQAPVQALYMSCHLVIMQPSEGNTTFLLVSQMRKLRLKVVRWLVTRLVKLNPGLKG